MKLLIISFDKVTVLLRIWKCHVIYSVLENLPLTLLQTKHLKKSIKRQSIKFYLKKEVVKLHNGMQPFFKLAIIFSFLFRKGDLTRLTIGCITRDACCLERVRLRKLSRKRHILHFITFKHTIYISNTPHVCPRDSAVKFKHFVAHDRSLKYYVKHAKCKGVWCNYLLAVMVKWGGNQWICGFVKKAVKGRVFD